MTKICSGGGWNWFSLSRKTAGYILDFCHDHPRFIERFQYTACCDELVFPSIVHPNAEELQIVSRNSLHYVDWKPNRPTNSLPLVLDERDYDSIVKSGMFFCRKVELPQSEKLLDMLDKKALIEECYLNLKDSAIGERENLGRQQDSCDISRLG